MKPLITLLAITVALLIACASAMDIDHKEMTREWGEIHIYGNDPGVLTVKTSESWIEGTTSTGSESDPVVSGLTIDVTKDDEWIEIKNTKETKRLTKAQLLGLKS